MNFKIGVAFMIFLTSLCYYSSVRRNRLPEAKFIDRSLFSEPLQTDTDEKPYVYEYRGKSYNIEPLANYEIRGLLVTHNNIHELGDIYHDKDSEDIRDLCLIWGSNLIDNNFHKIKFWSEPFGCVYYPKTWDVAEQFNESEWSNNHLLVRSPEVAREVWKAKIGDQVYIRGALISYAESYRPNARRTSSLTRHDKGQACEVLMVDEFRIIKKNSRFWHSTFNFTLVASVVGIIIITIFYLRSVYKKSYL